MLSFKGILKYGIYFFIAAWMFVLGIMVGRGNSPVNFDTEGFQKRLERIAGEFGRKNEKKKEVDLEFFKVLDQPVAEEKSLPKAVTPIPAKIKKKPDEKSSPAVKISTKKKTLQKKLPPEVKKTSHSKKQLPAKSGKQGLYTIQVAAYKNFKDAVSHMAMLDKKGISSYKQKSEKDGVTWYRVRTGSFSTIEAAKKYKEQLAKKRIKAMIIKKDGHENI